MRSHSAATSSGEDAILQTVSTNPKAKTIATDLFRALEDNGVRYCHWKSNCRLPDSLSGQEDLDILVHNGDDLLFKRILAIVGFRLARPRLDLAHPGVFHALALDTDTAELIHIHVYYQLVSGDSLVKSYHFPIEPLLLANTYHLHGVRVPIAEVEFLLFVIRIALKHVGLIEIIKINMKYSKVQAELRHLQATCDMELTSKLLNEWMPMVEPQLFRRIQLAIDSDRGLLSRVVLGFVAAWKCRGLRRLGIVPALVSRMRRILAYGLNRAQNRRDLVLPTRGSIVALVGPKASGKSTIASEITRRVGKKLSVVNIHAGKPPATALSFLPRLFVPIARRLMPGERLREYEKPERREKNVFSLFYTLRMLLIAYDRHSLLSRAFRLATSNHLIISDRYPSDSIGSIDSSCFDDDALAKCQSSFKRWLMRLERRLYREMPRPTLVLRLTTSLESAIQRDAQRAKAGGPDAEAVRRRWNLETSGELAAVPVELIDTSGSVDETVSRAIRAIWRFL